MEEGAHMKNITTEQLEQKLTSGEILNIIDVREDTEVATGMIPQAKHMPMGDIPNRLDELNKDEEYHIICHAGGRSMQVCVYLISKGYDVTNVKDGMTAWNGEIE